MENLALVSLVLSIVAIFVAVIVAIHQHYEQRYRWLSEHMISSFCCYSKDIILSNHQLYAQYFPKDDNRKKFQAVFVFALIKPLEIESFFIENIKIELDGQYYELFSMENPMRMNNAMPLGSAEDLETELVLFVNFVNGDERLKNWFLNLSPQHVGRTRLCLSCCYTHGMHYFSTNKKFYIQVDIEKTTGYKLVGDSKVVPVFDIKGQKYSKRENLDDGR